jgi:DNA-binding MarR family transcriptional regulator
MARPTHYGNSLSFLLSQTGARSAQLFAERLAPLGVPPRAFGVLSNLAAAEGQSQQQLADALGIHRNNMVALVDEMEAAGWLKRQRSHTDRRAFELHLTPAGRALVAKINQMIPELDATLAAGLTVAEQKQLRLLLRQLADGVGLTPAVHPHLAGRPR